MSKKEFISMNWKATEIWTILHNELIKTKKLIENKNKTLLFRTYVINLHSMIDGMIFSLRQELLEKHKSEILILSEDELSILNECTYNISEAGKVKRLKKRYDFKSMFRFTFKVYADKFNKTENLKILISENDYKSFQDFIIIRNRIVHPKETKDLIITKGEFTIVENAHAWVHKLFIEIFQGNIIELRK